MVDLDLDRMSIAAGWGPLGPWLWRYTSIWVVGMSRRPFAAGDLAALPLTWANDGRRNTRWAKYEKGEGSGRDPIVSKIFENLQRESMHTTST